MKGSHTVQSSKNSCRVTYQDVLDAPPNMVAEIVDGTLYMNPRPAMPHTRASSKLMIIVGSAFDEGVGGPGGWRIFYEPELHLGKNIVVPDIAGWRRERMPEPPTGAYCRLAPDWVCEALSPSTRELDLGDKKAFYASAGVGYLWFVDPDERSLEAFVLRNNDWVLIDKLFNHAIVSLPPFDAISFDLSKLWLRNVLHRSVPDSGYSESPTTELEAGLSQTAK